MSQDDYERSGLFRRLIVYGVAAAAVFIITMLMVILPEGKFALNIGLGSVDEILDTLLLTLTVLLLLLFLARLLTWAMAARREPETPAASPDAAISFDGINLAIMGSDFRVPEFMASMVHHVLEHHGNEISERARKLQADAGGEDLGGANWLFAYMQVLSAHLEEAESSVFESMAATAGQLVRGRILRASPEKQGTQP